MNVGPVIWVEGIIGSGKTRLTKALAEALELRALFEPVKSNPYLSRFYNNPKRWAFPMQIELLHRRYAMQKLAAFEATMAGGHQGAVLDRGLPGDRVFAKLHMLKGNMSEMEWDTYERAYDTMTCSLIPPSLLIYLEVDPEVALERVVKRARNAEVGIGIDYLRELHKGYLDLLVEIESSDHPWSRGMDTMRVPWNVDDQPIEPLVGRLRHRFRIGESHG